jgi:phenylacetate-CoA ligase
VIISNAEHLHPHQRRALQEGFGCPVRNTYGMSEIGPVATECERGQLHLWSDQLIVEVLDAHDLPVPPGQAGRFVVTSLVNPAMPLIRYVTGDHGSLAAPGRCDCGRVLPIVASLEGRSIDLLVGVDGRRVFWTNSSVYDLPIREAQLIQHSLTHTECRVVPDAGFNESHQQKIADRLRERLGPIEVTFTLLDSIPRGKNGKFRSVVSNCRHSGGAADDPIEREELPLAGPARR